MLFSFSPLRLQYVVTLDVQPGCCLAAIACDAALFPLQGIIEQCSLSHDIVVTTMLACSGNFLGIEWIMYTQSYLLLCVLQLVGACS